MQKMTEEEEQRKKQNHILSWVRKGRPRLWFESKTTDKSGKISTRTYDEGKNKLKLTKAERKQAIRRKRYEKEASQKKEVINQETQVAE